MLKVKSGNERVERIKSVSGSTLGDVKGDAGQICREAEWERVVEAETEVISERMRM